MAGNGPAPSPNRRRRNADTYANVQAQVVEDGKVRGPELVGRFRHETREWHNTWRRSAQAATFLPTDWTRLAMLAHLVDDYFDNPHHLKLAEIRQNESLLGATHVDRLKARIRVEKPEPPAAAPGVTALDEYRSRLTG